MVVFVFNVKIQTAIFIEKKLEEGGEQKKDDANHSA